MTQVLVQSNLESLINAHKENHLYAVVDGARDNQIHHNLVVCNADYYSLFFGEEAEDLEQVAPYLVKLKQGDLFTQWYLDHGFGNSMSILMSSSHTELELQDHLQSFAKPLMEFESDEGIKYQEVFLAFYDPRVFPNYLRSISMEHRVAFLQPFKAIFYESAKTVLNQLTLNATRNDVKSTLHDLSQAQSFIQIESELPPEIEGEINQDFQPIIDIETNRKLLDYNFQIFIDELLTNLVENNLIRTEEKSIKETSLKESSVKEARHYIQQQSREAQNRNITNEAAITYYVQAKLEYGVGFTDDPQYLHLIPILNNENISDINKADILFEAFEQYEKHVYGEENIHLNQAYKKALSINDDHLKKMSADVLLHFVYPEKFNYLKDNASSALEQLSHSANDYSKGKRWNNSFPIILLLMFLFGHQFYRDYRLQKLNEKIQELTKENAEPSAQQLIQLLQAGVADHG